MHDEPLNHRLSFAIPTWKDALAFRQEKASQTSGFSEQDFSSPFIKKLFDEARRKYSKKGEFSIVFPSKNTAVRALEFVEKKTGKKGTLDKFGKSDIFVISLPKELFEVAKTYWELSGEVISSREAKMMLKSTSQNEAEMKKRGRAAKRLLRERIAQIAGEKPQNVALFPSERATISSVLRFLQISFPERKSVQFGFPHKDVLKIQQYLGNGVHFFSKGDNSDMRQLEALLAKEKMLGIFCELPGNPMAPSFDLKKLKLLSKKFTIPLIFDDTIGTFQNAKVLALADIVISSLSKFFSGKENAPGGALILHSESRFRNVFARVFKNNYEDILFWEDAVTLEENSRDFSERMQKINKNAEALYAFLRKNPMVYKVFSSKFGRSSLFPLPKNDIFGGILSFLLYDPESSTPKFYDALQLKKSTSFGSTQTTACPYTQISQFDRLSLAKENGISPHLIQISVGTEDSDELIARFQSAFMSCTS